MSNTTILQKVFHIYQGEERRALIFAFLGALWAFGSTCGLKFADALFLIHVGAESLPQAYTYIACGMFAIAIVLLYAFHRFSSYSIYLTTLQIGITFYMVIFTCLYFDIGTTSVWLWYVLKLVGFYLFTVLMTCYWTFIDQYHHLQDAKRLYCLFSSSIFCGTTSTGLLMRSGWLDLNSLIILIIVLLVLTSCWIRKIARTVPLVAHEDLEPEKQIYESGNYPKFFLKTVISSPFTLLLVTSNLCIYLLLIITEYNYMFTFEHVFASDPQAYVGKGTESELTRFLGQWLAIISVCNLFFGLFIYSRLARRFGIHSLLFITPVLLIFAFTGWQLSTALLFPLIGFFVVEGTLYVIDDNNFNLLLNAVPSKLKYKIRVIIESFFEPIGTLLGAFLLSTFQSHSKLLGLVLALLALLIAWGLSTNYLKALFFNLSENVVRFQRTAFDWAQKIHGKQRKTAEQRLLSIFKIGDEQAQLFACEGLLVFQDPEILNQLLTFASFMKPQTKIKLLSFFENSLFVVHERVLQTLYAWLEDHDTALQNHVYFYLAKQGFFPSEKIEYGLHAKDILIRGAAIIALKKSNSEIYKTLASKCTNELLKSSDEQELCMGLTILGIGDESSDRDLLISHLTHPSLNVAKTASKALVQTRGLDPIQQAPLIISLLSRFNDSEVRLNCLRALKQVNDSSLVECIIQASIRFRPNERRIVEEIIFNMGLRTVPSLLFILKDHENPDRCRLLAGRILGRMALPQLQAHLTEIIEEKIQRTYFYIAHYHEIGRQSSGVDVSMLQDVLMTGYHSALDFIIQLLGVAGEIEDEELLSRALRSHNPKVRSQVVEALEKTCDPQIFRLLQPLIDEIPDREKQIAYEKMEITPLNLNKLLDTMEESSAEIDHIIAAVMKSYLNFPHWRESLRKQMIQDDELFHRFAYELLDS